MDQKRGEKAIRTCFLRLGKQNKQTARGATKPTQQNNPKTQTTEARFKSAVAAHDLRRASESLRNEKQILRNASGITTNIAQDAKQYARCLMQPHKYPTRIPEAGPSPSTLIKTTRVYDVPIFTRNGKRRYAGIFQPKFGISGRPETYQAAFVDFDKASAGSLAPNTTLPDSWVTLVNGTDIAIDENMRVLTQQSPYTSQWIATHPGQTARNRLNDDLTYVESPDGSPIATDLKTVVFSNSESYYTRVDIAPGNWIVSISVSVQMLTANSRPYELKKWSGSTKSDVPLLSEVYIPAAANTVVQYSSSYLVSISPRDYLSFENYQAQSSAYSQVIITISSSNVARQTNPEYGLLEKVRPVAMSVLATCTASELKAAGTCATMLTMAGMGDKIFTMNPTWASLEGLTSMTMEQAYQGVFKKGSFCWWRPVASESTYWYDPIASCTQQYPMILIVGEMPEDSDPSMKITFECVFEVQQNSQLFEKGHSASTTAAREMALNQVSRLVVATENPAHHELFGDLGSALGGWAGKLLSTIF